MHASEKTSRNPTLHDGFSKVHTFKTMRTEGDGMENEEIHNFDSGSQISGIPLCDRLIYRPTDLKECSSPVVPARGEVVNLLPKIMPSKKNISYNVRFSKEPRFVPYEPYKAATSPILQTLNKNKPSKFVKNVRFSVEDLVNMKKLKISEEDSVSVEAGVKQISSPPGDCPNWEEERKALREEIHRLQKEKSELENEVKFQTQINIEVKKLLVAAVGEDIETKVQLLTEDKLHLAKQLLSTAKTLSTHQEQIEWLAGQCEVWRSKFLASSMLVEDLAKWKAGLSQKVEECRNSLKLFLEDHDEMRQLEFQSFINLSTLQEKFNLDVIAEENSDRQIVSYDLNDLIKTNHHLTELLIAQLLHESIQRKNFGLDPLNCSTATERKAEEVLSQPVVSIKHTDIACNAVMTGAALALSATSPHCSHCTGTVTTV